jgi:hypothetical protein
MREIVLVVNRDLPRHAPRNHAAFSVLFPTFVAREVRRSDQWQAGSWDSRSANAIAKSCRRMSRLARVKLRPVAGFLVITRDIK